MILWPKLDRKAALVVGLTVLWSAWAAAFMMLPKAEFNMPYWQQVFVSTVIAIILTVILLCGYLYFSGKVSFTGLTRRFDRYAEPWRGWCSEDDLRSSILESLSGWDVTNVQITSVKKNRKKGIWEVSATGTYNGSNRTITCTSHKDGTHTVKSL